MPEDNAARIRDFGRNLHETSVALLFYAGHGLQVAGRNCLVPIDAALEEEADAALELIELQAIPSASTSGGARERRASRWRRLSAGRGRPPTACRA